MSSGVLCFLLEKDWTHKISSQSKIPLYAILGISIAFSLVYSFTDILQYLVFRCCRNTKFFSIPFAISHVRLLMCTASICGLYYGWIFGILDSEDVNRPSLELFIQKENFYCYPLAATLGGFSGFYVYYKSLRVDSLKLELRSYVENQGDDL